MLGCHLAFSLATVKPENELELRIYLIKPNQLGYQRMWERESEWVSVCEWRLKGKRVWRRFRKVICNDWMHALVGDAKRKRWK